MSDSEPCRRCGHDIDQHRPSLGPDKVRRRRWRVECWADYSTCRCGEFEPLTYEGPEYEPRTAYGRVYMVAKGVPAWD